MTTSAAGAIQVLWEDAVYGAAEGMLLSVLPLLVLWQTCDQIGWTTGWTGKAGSGALAFAGSLLVIGVHHLGYPEILATVVSFAMFGLIFAAPQYFQAVLGATPLGAGVRLLPLVAGLAAGGVAAGQVVQLAGAKVTVAAGFALIAAGLIAGTFTRTATGYGFAAFWITVLGAGLGLALPTAMDAAIDELSADRSEVGSAVITAVRTVGGTLGVAVLGSVLNSAYRAHLPLPSSVPPAAATAIRSSVMAGVAAATKLGSLARLRPQLPAHLQPGAVAVGAARSRAAARRGDPADRRLPRRRPALRQGRPPPRLGRQSHRARDDRGVRDRSADPDSGHRPLRHGGLPLKAAGSGGAIPGSEDTGDREPAGRADALRQPGRGSSR